MLSLNNTLPIRIAQLASAPMLILLSIAIGSFIGHNELVSGQWISDTTDPTLFTLIVLLFFTVRFDHVLKASTHIRFLAIALFANFIIVPLIGYSIASLILTNAPLFMVGLMIYFMSPCTDWFLAFTRIVNGNTLVGTTLLPLNMMIQLILYPVFLYLFTHNVVEVQHQLVTSTLIEWFLKPLLIALALRFTLQKLLNQITFDHIISAASKTVPFVTSLLVIEIFASNIDTLLLHSNMFIWMLLGVFTFFLLTFLLSEVMSSVFKLDYPEYALLTMTVAARNAPLMLAITMIALPNQPVIYASIVVGMLLEFPHLTMLTFILRRKQNALNKVSL